MKKTKSTNKLEKDRSRRRLVRELKRFLEGGGEIQRYSVYGYQIEDPTTPTPSEASQ